MLNFNVYHVSHGVCVCLCVCVCLFQLSRIEAELRQSVRLDVERQQEAEFLRQQENKQLRTHLCYLSLSQRVAK